MRSCARTASCSALCVRPLQRFRSPLEAGPLACPILQPAPIYQPQAQDGEVRNGPPRHCRTLARTHKGRPLKSHLLYSPLLTYKSIAISVSPNIGACYHERRAGSEARPSWPYRRLQFQTDALLAPPVCQRGRMFGRRFLCAANQKGRRFFRRPISRLSQIYPKTRPESSEIYSNEVFTWSSSPIRFAGLTRYAADFRVSA